MRHVLMIAHVFPPFFSVGGSIRAVKFAKYLPECGWQPHVLTIDDRVETTSQRRQGSAELLAELPPNTPIHRTPSGEPPASLQAKGRAARDRSRVAAVVVNVLSRLRRWVYRYVLIPDANITWLPAAVRAGRRIVREAGIEAIWVTCPPHSAALIGALLKRLTHRPLIVDYRDDWIDTPWFRAKPRAVQWLERRLERWIVGTADRVVLVTPASHTAFVARYPQRPLQTFNLIPNGCDLAEFTAAQTIEVGAHATFNIVHAGLLTVDRGWHRSPAGFFAALRQIAQEQPDMAAQMKVTFTGQLPEAYRQIVAAHRLSGLVHEAGFLPRGQLLRTLREADLLLTINYEDFSTLIPGKLYEYWAIGRAPILLLDGQGAAQQFVEQYALGQCVRPDDVAGIAAAIQTAYRQRAAGTPLTIDARGVEQYDRRALTHRLATVLDTITAQGEQTWHTNWLAGWRL